jgi:two-component system, cell cycle response regulator DivK
MDTQKEKILIIDDDRKNIFALTAVLKAKRYHTVSAQTAEDGIKLLLEDDTIKLVLLDMMMPDLDGYETINIIRGTEKIKAKPLIAVTAQAMVGDREKCIAAGADDYVAKPVNIDVLIELIEKYKK